METTVIRGELGAEPAASPPPADTTVGLLKAIANGSFVCSVRVRNRPETYLSRTFVLDETSGCITLDAPRVPVIARLLQEGAVAQVEVMLKHLRLVFEADVIRISGTNGSARLVLALPSVIRQRQRHEFGRLAMPQSFAARLS
ncbi:MAG TPA: flagellar regulator YcgR PilZN domain-containing protein, partial [Burkholderiaceae bacterium]|nr:flagellar regulator YcgR PilZN domain-containing protein [Burkholderiaceae bacterium]